MLDLDPQTFEVMGAFKRLTGFTGTCLLPVTLGFSEIFNPETMFGSSRPVVAVPELSPFRSLAVAAGRAHPAVLVLVEAACCSSGGRFAGRRKDVFFVSRPENPPSTAQRNAG